VTLHWKNALVSRGDLHECSYERTPFLFSVQWIYQPAGHSLKDLDAMLFIASRSSENRLPPILRTTKLAASVAHTDQLRINCVLKGGQQNCVIASLQPWQNLTALEPDEKCQALKCLSEMMSCSIIHLLFFYIPAIVHSILPLHASLFAPKRHSLV
jgi:hypothetical protein